MMDPEIAAALNPASDSESEEEEPLGPLTEEEKKQADEKKKKALSELDDLFQNHPLFMKSLPKNPQENEHIAALHSLMYDDTPENVAMNFKNQGNDDMADKDPRSYKEAIYCYTEGILQNCKDKELNSILHSNRAQAHLLLKNYGHCINDCHDAITFNPKNVKAYYRGATAAYELDKYELAIDFCNHGLEVSPDNKNFKDIVVKSEKLKKDKENKLGEMKSIQSAERAKIFKALQDRNVIMGRELYDMPQTESSIYMDNDGNLHFPILFLYEESMQTDFIQDCHEFCALQDQVDFVLAERPPWDNAGHYTAANVDIYYEANAVKPLIKDKKLAKTEVKYVKVDTSKCLLECITRPFYILPQIPIFHVVPRGTPFAKAFLERS